MFRRLLLLLGLILCHGHYAPAQDLPRRDPQALAILHQSLALAGLSASVPQTLTVSGSFSRFEAETDMTVAFRVRALGSDRVRWEFDYTEGTAVSIVNKGGGWRASPKGGSQLSVGQVPGQTLEYFPAVALAMWLAEPTTKVTLHESEVIDGLLQHKVEIRRTYPGNNDPGFRRAFEQVMRCDVYLDAGTHRILRLRYFDHSRDWRRGLPVDLYFSDYQTIAGILLPLSVTRQIGSRKESEFRISDVVVNGPVAESEFVEVRQ